MIYNIKTSAFVLGVPVQWLIVMHVYTLLWITITADGMIFDKVSSTCSFLLQQVKISGLLIYDSTYLHL